jgi:hypothetical protein
MGQFSPAPFVPDECSVLGMTREPDNSVDNELYALTLRALIGPRIVQPTVRIPSSPARRSAPTSGAKLGSP